MKFAVNTIGYLFPSLKIIGSKWNTVWILGEKSHFLMIARITYIICILGQIYHFHYVDMPSGKSPTHLWFFYRFGLALLYFLALLLTFTPISRSLAASKLVFATTCSVLVYTQTLSMVWSPSTPYFYTFVLLVIGTVTLRLSVVPSLLYFAANLAFCWRIFGQVNLEDRFLYSGIFVSIAAIVSARVRMNREVEAFLSNHEKLETQKAIASVQIELNQQIRAFLPRVVYQRIELLLETKHYSIFQALDEVLKPKKRTVACVYSDIRGFTRGSRNFEFIRDSALPNIRSSTEIVENCSGIPRLIGDLIFSYFDHEEERKNIVSSFSAAILLIKNNLLMNESVQEKSRINRFVLMSYGEAVVGNMGGNDGSREITALGSVVNILSRIDLVTKMDRARSCLDPSFLILTEPAASAVRAFIPEVSIISLDLEGHGLTIPDYPEERFLFLVSADDALGKLESNPIYNDFINIGTNEGMMKSRIAFREFNPDFKKAVELIHAPVDPLDIRSGDSVYCVLRRKGSQVPPVEMKVWRISPLGLELLLDDAAPGINVGEEVELELKVGKDVCDFPGLVVAHQSAFEGKRVIGIRLCRPSESEVLSATDRRVSKRWICFSEFMPSGVASNPVRFDDFIYFRVRDISISGMQVLTSLRNKLLIPGMKLESLINFPMTSQIKASFTVVNARVERLDGKDFLALGVKFHSLDYFAKNTIGQYIMQFGPPTTIEELRKEGLSVPAPSKALHFSSATTADEYRQVLELRRIAYVGAGKMSEDTVAEQTGDIFDTRARIITASYRGKVIASLRLMFHEGSDQMEHEQFVGFPESFPRRDEIVEITRVCTHPDFRGSDLLAGLMKQASKVVVESKRKWVLGSSTSKLLPLYERLGLKVTDITYEHKDVGGDKHYIFLGNVYKGISGLGVSPLVWNYMYSDLSRYIEKHELAEFGQLANIRMTALRTLAPLNRLLGQRIRKRSPKLAKKQP